MVVAAAVVALGGFVSYGADGGISRTLRSALSLVLLYTVSMPVVSLVGDIDDLALDSIVELTPTPDMEESEYYEVAQTAFCDGVRRLVCESFSLRAEEVEVHAFDFDVESMRAQKIKIILSGGAVYADARSIASAVSDAELGDCEVELEIGG